MNRLFGITKIQVFTTSDIIKLNQFLLEHDGDIIDIQCTEKDYNVIYQGGSEDVAMLKEYCNNKPSEIIKTLLQSIFIGSIGALWFYIIALVILLIGG